jgi:hypothetical protein
MVDVNVRVTDKAGNATSRVVNIAIKPSTPGGGSILPYLDMPGDQIVRLRPGTYTAGDFTKTRPATTGPLKGWLVLVAEEPGSVVLDLAPPDAFLPSAVRGLYNGNGRLVLRGAQRLVLGDVKCINGQWRIMGDGADIATWYVSHEFPSEQWFTYGADPAHPQVGNYYPGPRTFDQLKGRNVTLAGSTFGKTGTALSAGGSRSLTIQGSTFHGPYTDRDAQGRSLDPDDVCHPDCFAAYSGHTDNLALLDSSLKGRWGAWDGRMNWDSHEWYVGGPVHVRYERVWNDCSQHNQGFTFAQFNANAAPNYGVQGTMKDIRCWASSANTAPLYRIDYLTDGPSAYHTDRPPTVNKQPTRINVTEQNVVYGSAPSGGLTSPQNPATLWRAAWPIESLADYFGWLV